LPEKFEAFGWAVRTVDGHDVAALTAALSAPLEEGKPSAIIARTVKGRGVSFMEDVGKWHHGVPNDEEYARAPRRDRRRVGQIPGGKNMSAPAPSMYSSPQADRRATRSQTRTRQPRGIRRYLAHARSRRPQRRRRHQRLRGSGKLGPFGAALPAQIVEVGIAEQNLVGVAAGLASVGKNVFAVSPACFLTARSFEQIKNDVAYSDNKVTLVGISAGVSYGAFRRDSPLAPRLRRPTRRRQHLHRRTSR